VKICQEKKKFDDAYRRSSVSTEHLRSLSNNSHAVLGKLFTELEVFLSNMQKKYNRDMYLKQIVKDRQDNDQAIEEVNEESRRKRKEHEVEQVEDRISRRNKLDALHKSRYGE